MLERKSLKWPITIAVLMIIALVALAVGWILLNVFSALGSDKSAALYWALLSVGSAAFVAVLVGVVFYLVLSIQQINLARRQSNFIDSVTHELKSPIASLKLYLQTLANRNVEPQQQQIFYDSMLEDVERLDQLINHLLDVARFESRETSGMPVEKLAFDALVESVALGVVDKHSSTRDQLTLQLQPFDVVGRRSDLEILCRNLIDNAFKYGGEPPEVVVSLNDANRDGFIRLTVCDNGPGIPRNLRRRVFGRFFRIGNELQRKKPGTGLGLFLVRAVVKQMKGRISIVDRPNGTEFEVLLPKPLDLQRLTPKSSSHLSNDSAVLESSSNLSLSEKAPEEPTAVSKATSR